jgi:hypothetical protein
MTDGLQLSPSAVAAGLDTSLNSPARVLLASMIGTTIEFFDFYVYATAAVLVFPTLFFPNSDPTTALLASFATFSIAFFRALLAPSCSAISATGSDARPRWWLLF